MNKTNTYRIKCEKARKKVDALLFFILKNSDIDEVWKEISWTDERYFVSDKGRVISLCNSKPIILKPFICGDGYYCVSICNKDKRIHRLVAQAFIDNIDNKPIVHHIDGNKCNNKKNNLMWATHKENTKAYYDSLKKVC